MNSTSPTESRSVKIKQEGNSALPGSTLSSIFIFFQQHHHGRQPDPLDSPRPPNPTRLLCWTLVSFMPPQTSQSHSALSITAGSLNSNEGGYFLRMFHPTLPHGLAAFPQIFLLFFLILSLFFFFLLFSEEGLTLLQLRDMSPEENPLQRGGASLWDVHGGETRMSGV